MPALKAAKRRNTARAVAERLGVSERTVQRLMAQPREEYLAEARARQARALELREEGRTWAEVGQALGGMTPSGAYQLAAKAKARRS